MPRLPFTILLILLSSTACRGAEVSRVLTTFDFEERSLGNEESLPMHWMKVQGPGLPHYVNGQLTSDRHRSGSYSFRFDLNGGSLIYRYGAGLIPVQRGAHYRINAYCQTTPLAHARARLTAYLVDLDGHTIPGSIAHSRLYAASQDDVGWKPLGVEVSAESAQAASIVLELELLQPELYRADNPGQRPLFPQDIRGSAWWDDVTVSQVPEVSLRTGRPGNIFSLQDPVRLGILVSDRSTDDLAVQIAVRDAEGREVYQRTGRPDLRHDEAAGQPTGGMILDLPRLRPGWYQAALTTSSGGRSLGTQSLAFIVLPDDAAPVPPDGRFGFIATQFPLGAWDELPRILPMLSAGRVKLAVWNSDGDVGQNSGAAFDQLLNRLSELGIAPTACLTALPPKIADSIGSDDWKQLLKVPAGAWQPDLAFLVSRHANHLDRWQLGEDGSADFVNDPAMREVYRRVFKEFALLVAKPDLAMPWPAWHELSGDLPATVALDLPSSIMPEQLPLYIDEIRGRSDHKLSLTIEPVDRERYGRLVQARDLAQRVIYALSAGAKRIDLPLPFTASRDRDGMVTEPQELVLVMRTLISTLSGAQFKGKVAIADGVDAFLFDRAGHGILAMWDQAGGGAGKRDLAINLGPRPARIDLWGNVAPLPRPPGEKNSGRVSLTIGPMPIFLVDIDGPQAQLRASVAIDRPMLESSFVPHLRRLHFVNSYPQAISGAVHIKAPAGWTLNPPTFTFNLNPDQVFDRELTIQFPYNSVAGPRTLDCEFFVEGQQSSPFAVPINLKLGLTDVGMQTLARRDGRDVFVQQIITNYGDKPISYNAFATYPRQARQERLVTDLAPGATTVRRYRFENVSPSKDATIRVGMQEMSGSRFLNEEEVNVQ